ncbi:MAG: hypothetical protein LBQ46_06640 [Treponema sp.]|jgi:hypothetical protein|nr:hypothetical protein [Treponema sp.]
MKNNTLRNALCKAFSLALSAVLGALLLNACINPISGEYEIPAIGVTINPATEAVLVFKNDSSAPKKTNVWLTPHDPGTPGNFEYYESTVSVNSSYVVTETASDGKVIPKRFKSGNLYFAVEGSAQAVYTVAAFGVTYVTLRNGPVDSGGGPTTVINVEVVNPGGPFAVQLVDGNFTIQLDNSQFGSIKNYLDQKLMALVLVWNRTSFNLTCAIENVPYGTLAEDIPPGENRTIALPVFDQANANYWVTATNTANPNQSKKTYVNVWRGYEYDEQNHINYVEFTAADFPTTPSASGSGRFVATARSPNWNRHAYSDDGGVTWKQTRLQSFGCWDSAAYGNGRFVTIDHGSIVNNVAVPNPLEDAAYSNDGGASWFGNGNYYDPNAGMPSISLWEDVAFGDNRFVAIALNDNKAAVSDDGITWLGTNMPRQAYWEDVTYGGGKFVAVADDWDRAAWSDDGINWHETNTLPYPGAKWECVTYGNGMFVAIAIRDNVGASSSNKAAYSYDGINWTGTTLPDAGWETVVYGAGKFVALSYSDDDSPNKAAYSTNGITWTEMPPPLSAAYDWYNVTYGNDGNGGGRFVAIAQNSSTAAWSNDGATWTAATLPGITGWRGLASD